MEIGKQIQNIRKENGLSQEQFGQKFHVARQTVSNWENEKSYPDLQTLIDISDNYHISMDKLLKETPKMIEGFDRAAIEAKKRKRTIIILLLILIMLPVLLISVFFIRLAYALQATPFDKRNVTQVDARMYVNLPDQTPSDAIVYTYDKEEYDTFSKQR